MRFEHGLAGSKWWSMLSCFVTVDGHKLMSFITASVSCWREIL